MSPCSPLPPLCPVMPRVAAPEDRLRVPRALVASPAVSTKDSAIPGCWWDLPLAHLHVGAHTSPYSQHPARLGCAHAWL